MTTTANRALGFDVNPDACSGLTFGVKSGAIFGSGQAPGKFNPQKVLLEASSTNYVEVDSTGKVSSNTTGFTSGRDFLYVVTTTATGIDTVADWRFNPGVSQPTGTFSTVTVTGAARAESIGVGIAPSATSILAVLAGGLAADASSAAVGDIYANATSGALTIKT